MSSNNHEDTECLLTQTAQNICHKFVLEVRESTEEFGVWSDVSCFAQRRPYGCRVVLQVYRDQDLRSQTIVRLSSFLDIHFLECLLKGHRDSLYESIKKIVESISLSNSQSTSHKQFENTQSTMREDFDNSEVESDSDHS